MLNALVIVFRESLEAMLIIGVLMAWIARQPAPQPLRRGVWLGVAAGVGLAIALGLATFAAQSELAGRSLEIFQLSIVLIAAGLILQMVLWMHRHGRQMKRQLESQADQAGGALGVAMITALAVAREGAETVVYIYGLGLQEGGAQLLALLLAALSGFALAGATAWVLARGARRFSLQRVMGISEVLLLLVAGALLVNGVDRMIALDWLPPLADPLWDTSAWVDDGHGVGSIMASFLGYRARPSGVLVLCLLSFWAFAVWRMRSGARRA
ncbi:MAG: FTR1 family protein [Burkholderiales bacterium]|nr:FTR1 family protein [Burkholderiales bacterium]